VRKKNRKIEKSKIKKQRCYWELIFIILSQQVAYTNKAQVGGINTKIKRKCNRQNWLGTKIKEIKFVRKN
jgi:hypothetical protein